MKKSSQLSCAIFSALVKCSDGFSASSVPSISPNPNSLCSDDALNDCISRAEQQHQSEILLGEKIFGCSTKSSDLDRDGVSQFSDDDFISYSVGEGHGGPSENNLRNGHFIFESKEAIFSESKCQYFIEAARETIERERSSDETLTNSALGEARISKLPPDAISELRSLLAKELYPILTDRFGTEELVLYDGLILGSVAPSLSQPVHRDASLLTLNIALSSPDDFENGGTYVEGLQNHDGLPLRIDQGKLLCHASGVQHAGTAITSGERWVLVLFVIAKNETQIARRTHAEALELIHTKSLSEAKIALEAGLSDAPNDHILHMGLGQIASMRGDEHESLNRLLKASKLYPASHKAAMTAGKILESKRRARAALRRYEQVLSDVDNKDMLAGAWMPLKASTWDARVSAGRCALLCAEDEAGRIHWSDRERSWTKTHLPEAIKRFRTSLLAVPGDGYIQSMLARAEELLTEANEFPGN